ncbi:MAG: FHA domain-containing protein [Planctomycetota bacterium]
MVAAELKVVGGKHSGQVIPLNRRKFLIGREQDCQLRPNSDMVSRHHCVFSVDDFSVRLRDLGSTNGTLVNGEKIRRETVLEAGDRIVIGNLEFEFSIRTGVVVESDSKVTSSVSLSAEETQVTSRTVLELPQAAPVAVPEGSQTQNMPAIAPEAISTPAQSAAVPPISTNDTTVLNPGQMMPGQYPYQPMMQPMGFPGAMYGGFPYQQPMMPGYGQMYPQMMPQVMPQMGYPMPGYPQQQPSSAAPAAPAAGKVEIEVSLPDPEQTGAKESEAPKGSGGSNPKDTAKPTGAADAIIKQYMGRRPGT